MTPGAVVAGTPWSTTAHLYLGHLPTGGGRLPERSVCGARTTSLRALPDDALAYRRPCRSCARLWFRLPAVPQDETRVALAGLTARDAHVATYFAVNDPVHVQRLAVAVLAVVGMRELLQLPAAGGLSLLDRIYHVRRTAEWNALTPEEQQTRIERREQEALEQLARQDYEQRVARAERRDRWEARRDIWRGFNLSPATT